MYLCAVHDQMPISFLTFERSKVETTDAPGSLCGGITCSSTAASWYFAWRFPKRRRSYGAVMATRSVISGPNRPISSAEPLPKRLLYIEPLRRRMRVRFGGDWIADSEHVLLLFEPGHYPIAYFPETDISPDTLQPTEKTTRHPDLGPTSWY